MKNPFRKKTYGKGVSHEGESNPQEKLPLCVPPSQGNTPLTIEEKEELNAHPNRADILGTFIINLILESAFRESTNSPDYHPLSLILLGKAGTGKSRLLMTIRTLKKKYLDFISYTDDITPKFLVEFLKKVERGEKRFLVIPDFQVITHSHGRKTYGTTISILRQMISDGVGNLDDFGLEFHPKFLVRAGLITATTISSYSEFAVAWKRDGFLSRLIPFSFIHGKEVTNQVLASIIEEMPDSLRNVHYEINRNPQVKPNPQLYLQLKGYAEQLGKQTEAMPYRAMKQLIALTELTAIVKGDLEVTQEHINFVIELLAYVNYDFNAV
jgi:hypothetical protein